VELGRSFAVRGKQYAWLLGAGASASANIPTGYDMIMDFKARLFCEAMKVPRREIDTSDPLWSDRIESHFDGANGLPSSGHPDEYAAAFEAVFPSEVDRRAYIDSAVTKGVPSFGHRVLGSLLASGQTHCVFTTNFDHLVERCTALAEELLPGPRATALAVAAIDSADRAERCLNESAWPLLVKLHGDYQSVQLKNTATELQKQDETLRRAFVNACNRFGLIVVGYSGRDSSVMEALTEALEGPSPFPAGLRWVVRGGKPPLEAVTQLMELATAKGVETTFVDAETFDELAADIDRQASFPAELSKHVREHRPILLAQPVALPTIEAGSFPVLRCSALPIVKLPAEARSIRLSQTATTAQARDALKAANVSGIVSATGQSICSFGKDSDLTLAFSPLGGVLNGVVSLDPENDSSDLGLVYDGLARALTRGRPLRPILRRTGHSIVVSNETNRSPDQIAKMRTRLSPLTEAYQCPLTGTVPGTNALFAEAVQIRLETYDSQWWCVFEPFTWVDDGRTRGSEQRGEDLSTRRARPVDPSADWRRERWAKRYNGQWSAILDAWSALLVSNRKETISSFGLDSALGIDASFTLSGVTAWSRPGRVVPGRKL
jgi:SIR2-like domain